jgi:GNAT superfamily N-acetyltransferase
VARSDLEFFREIVQNGALRELELWIECEDAVKPRGFIGLFGAKIEALFIAPEFHGRGIGRGLVQHAEQLKGPKLQVDVNDRTPAHARSIAGLDSNRSTFSARSDRQAVSDSSSRTLLARVVQRKRMHCVR